MNKTYLIVSGTIKDPDKIAKYKEAAGPVMKKYGGILPPTSYKVNTVLAGDLNPQFLLQIEFPNVENIKAAFDDPDYTSVIALRDSGFADLSIYIANTL